MKWGQLFRMNVFLFLCLLFIYLLVTLQIETAVRFSETEKRNLL